MNEDSDLERDTPDVTDLRMTEGNLERTLAPHPMIEREVQRMRMSRRIDTLIRVVEFVLGVIVIALLIWLVIFYSGYGP